MNIEDLVVSLDINDFPQGWDKSFVSSVVSQIVNGHGLTEKQSSVAIKILKKYQTEMFPIVGDMTFWLNSPTYRIPQRSVTTNNYRGSIILDENRKKIIKLEFPFNQEYINQIRKESTLNNAFFDRSARAWMLELNETAIKLCISFQESAPFVFDDELTDYVSQAKTIIQDPEKYIPSLILENGVPTYKNVSEHVPPLTSSDILTSVVEARRVGITVWDDEIQNFVNSQNTALSTLLKLPNSKSMAINEEINDISVLSPIVRHLNPALVIIPAGEELKKLEAMYNLLIKDGYTNKDISVMFRLPSENGEKFNNFVKNNSLNSPISLDTKFVFICTKLPKPVLKSKMKFSSVINLGYWNVHYTVREFVKTCQNVVYYTNNKLIKDLHLANM